MITEDDICQRFERYLELYRDRSRRHLIDDDPYGEVWDVLHDDIERGVILLAKVIEGVDDAKLHKELAVGPIEDFFSTRTDALNAIAPHMKNAEPLRRALQTTYLLD